MQPQIYIGGGLSLTFCLNFLITLLYKYTVSISFFLQQVHVVEGPAIHELYTEASF